MPTPIVFPTFEEIAARLEHKRQLKSAKNKRYYETHAETHRAYYEANKDRLNRRTCELKHAQLLARKAAAFAPATPPDL